MKKKVGTVIDEHLIFKLKRAALARKVPLSRILEDALNAYLVAEKKATRKPSNIAIKTKGAMKISPSKLKTILEEEGLYC